MSVRLFVGGLPYSITSSDLEEMFAKYGDVVSADVISDRFTNQSKGFGFVEMKDDKSAKEAIKELHDTEIEGRKIAVSVARPREERSESNNGRGQNRSFGRQGGGRRGY